jgi:cell division protease FtsH
MYADLAVTMGGRVAEELIFGHDKVSSGASGDIQQATKLARSMVTRWGMSDKLGPLQYEEAQAETFLGYSQSQRVNMSNETAQMIDSEIRRLVDGGYNQAKTLLTDNLGKLKILAEAMLEYETISGDEIKALLDHDIKPDRSGIDHNKPRSLNTGGSSIPKTRRPGKFGDPAAQGA